MKRPLLTALLVVIGCTVNVPTFAQRAIEEIIVTATKREQSIQDVPIAISAFSGADLAARGITEVDDLMQVSPSLFINTSNSTTNGGTMRIRGVGTTGNNVGLEAAVGFFIDGIYRSRSGQALNDLVDIERVEVLRGPQGTLFGKNTSAGAVHVLSNRPEFENSGSIGIGAGNLSSYEIDGDYTGGLTDELAFRIAGTYKERDGYYENIDGGDDYANRERYSIKGQLLWEPTDTLEARLIIDYTNKDETCCPATYSLNGTGTPLILALGGTPVVSDNGDSGVNFDPFEEVDDGGATLHVNWDLGWAELQSVTGYRDFQVDRGQDVDFSNADVYLVGNTEEEFETISQELRLVGDWNDFDWLVGVYASNEQIDNSGRFLRLSEDGPLFFGLAFGDPVGIPPLLDVDDGLSGTFSQDGDSYAIFTHNVWHVTDRWDITAGLRFSWDNKDGDSRINDTGTANVVDEDWPCAAVTVSTFCDNAGYSRTRHDDAEPTGTLKASYAFTDDLNAYVSYSRGYKSGGFNLDPTSYKIDDLGTVIADATEFVKETIDSGEIGVKSQWLDGLLTINAAAWYAEIDDFQLNTFEGAFFTVNNVPDVDSKGIELEYAWAILDGVMFQGGVTLLDTRYGHDAGSQVGKPGLDDKRITNAPEWQASQSLIVDRELTFLDGYRYTFNFNWFFLGKHNTGSSLGPEKEQDDVSIFNGQLGIRTADERYEATLWGNNLLDQTYDVIIFNSVSQGSSRSRFVGAPRTWGLTLRANF